VRAPSSSGNGIELAIEEGDIGHAHSVASCVATDCGGEAGCYGGTVSMLVEFGDSGRIAVLIGTNGTRNLGALTACCRSCAAKAGFGDVQISVRPEFETSRAGQIRGKDCDVRRLSMTPSRHTRRVQDGSRAQSCDRNDFHGTILQFDKVGGSSATWRCKSKGAEVSLRSGSVIRHGESRSTIGRILR
jgi:hypothetical protein